MFAIPSRSYANFDFDNFLAYIHEQEAQRRLQAQRALAKIVKKVETEDSYQFQIYKEYGNFDSYEVKVLKHYDFKYNNLINLVILSGPDNFKKVFQFNVNDIEINQIDWEYFGNENVLVLNVPKKVRYCEDFSSALLSELFGLSPRNGCARIAGGGNTTQVNAEAIRRAEAADQARRAEIQAEKQREAELKAIKQAEIKARREEELKRKAEKKEAERKAREAELKAREAERKARETELLARKEAEAKARDEAKKARIAELRAKKEAEVKSRHSQTELNELAKQQEFLQQFVTSLFPQGSPFVQNGQPQDLAAFFKAFQHAQQSKEAPEKPNGAFSNSLPASTAERDVHDSETESISSEPETEDSPVNSEGAKSPLQRHPSIEEVEDEEFVVFRKKFGH